MINNNRQQNGRRRGRGGGGGGPRPQGNPGRPDGGGNRIDSRARGNAQQLHEKYKNLARDSQMAGDRVTTEYYLQFADHYFRVLSETRARFDEQRPQQQQQRNDGEDEFDGEEADDFQAREPRDNQQRRDRGDRDRGYRREDERRERQPEQADDQPQPVQADGGEELRRERRPRRPRRDEEGAEPQALDVDRLPPAIAVDSNDDGGEESIAPRRRGRRPRVESANDPLEVPPVA